MPLPERILLSLGLVLALHAAARGGPAPAARRPRLDRHGVPLPAGALARMGTVKARPPDPVAALALSPDGKCLATVSPGVVTFWEFATRKLLRQVRLPGGKPEFHSAAFSPDGKLLAAAGEGGYRFWEAGSGKEVRRFGEAKLFSAAFSPDGKTLAGGLIDGAVGLWEVSTGKLVGRLVRNQDTVRALAFSPDGKTLAVRTGVAERTVRLWDVASRKVARTHTGPDYCSGPLAFSPDGKALASACFHIELDGRDSWEVRLWDADTGKDRRRLPLPHAKSFAFSPDGKTLAAGAFEQRCLWDVATGKELRRVAGPPYSCYRAVTFSPDGTVLAAVHRDRVRLWDAVTWRELPAFGGHTDTVTSVAFSADGERLFSAGPDGTVRAWEAATGKELDTFEQGQAVTGLALSPDGRLLAAATYGWLSVWDVAGRRESLRLGGVCRAVAFSAAGRLTAVREGGVVQARDAERGRIARTFPTGSLYTHLSPDGKAVASLDMGMTTFTDMPHPYPAGPIRLWATATGKQLRVFGKEPGPAPGLVRLAGLPGAGPRRVSFSPDGRLLAWFDGAGKFRAAEAATGQEIEPLAIPDGLYQFSPDGRTLALRAGKRPIELLELATARVRQRIAVDQEPVSCMAFSPDGKTLAVGRADCTILIWDATARPRGAPRALDALWADLAAPDAARAYEAVCALAAAPRQAVPLLEKRLRSPAPDQTDRRIEGLIRDLDDEQFRVRQQAEVGLKELGGRVKPALRAALRGRPSLEVRRRVERLLEELKDARVIPSPQRLRLLRSVEVLERIGDAAARRALARLAARGAADPLSQEAKAALGRLARLPAR